MSKGVLMSIQPKWVEPIANGKKIIEIRKNKPKLQTPFKVYIYCTKGEELWLTQKGVKSVTELAGYLLNGKVIGEFVCDKVYDFSQWQFDYFSLLRHLELFSKVGYKFLDNYLKGQKKGYAWHISNLVIYDQPKELWEFCKGCDDSFDIMYGSYCKYCDKRNKLTRPPQSWCYVEELDND